MGAFKTLDMDIDLTLSQLKNITGKTYPVAITEYAMLDIQTFFHGTSFTSALYAADLLHYFVTKSDIFMTNYWSIVGNSVFGAVWAGVTAMPRPVYFVFEEYSAIFSSFTGDPVIVPMTLQTNHSISTPEVGPTSATVGIPPVTGMSVTAIGEDHVYVFLLNKDLNNSASVTINIPDFGNYGNATVTTKEFYTSDVMVSWTYYDNPGAAAGLNWTLPVTQDVPFAPLQITMKPHSLMSIKIVLNPDTPTTTTHSTTDSTTGSSTTSGSHEEQHLIYSVVAVLFIMLCYL
jgi:hypothetical protein